MNSNEYQKLLLALMSVEAIQSQVKEQLDALYMEIAALIPEEEGRGRHIPSLDEALKKLKDACTREHGTHRTKPHVRKKITQLQVVSNNK